MFNYYRTNFLILKNKIKYWKEIKDNKVIINNLFNNSNAVMLQDNEEIMQMWKKTFSDYNRCMPHEALKMAEAFVSSNIKLSKKTYYENISKDNPILLCNVRNDLERIQMLIEHHKKIGVQYFAILDNNSDDGTYEWLMKQDVDVFSVEDKYNSIVRAAWIAKVASYYGLDRWFIIVDSDELLVYEGMEEKNIQTLISEMQTANLERGLGFMIDMYAEKSDLKKKNEKQDIYSHYKYFDTKSYSRENGTTQVNIFGGPRDRYFGRKEDKARELLTKYPVVYWNKGEIYRYHYMFPFFQNFKSPIFLGLFHYKFIDGDYDKYLNIVKEGNYAGGSGFYKRYIERLGNSDCISFLDEQSCEFRTSDDLNKINIFNKK